MREVTPELKAMFRSAQQAPQVCAFEAHGLDCIIVKLPDLHYCGYVTLPDGHDLLDPILDTHVWEDEHDKYEKERLRKSLFLEGIRVHGGITYRERSGHYTVNGKTGAIGYDCGHSGDIRFYREKIEEATGFYKDEGERRDLDYNIEQTTSLAKQLASYKEA